MQYFVVLGYIKKKLKYSFPWILEGGIANYRYQGIVKCVCLFDCLPAQLQPQIGKIGVSLFSCKGNGEAQGKTTSTLCRQFLDHTGPPQCPSQTLGTGG